VRELDQVEAEIARRRADVELQRRLVEALRTIVAPTKAIRNAELVLDVLKQHLTVLRERRKAILSRQRRREMKKA
jgi:hypothetical protein